MENKPMDEPINKWRARLKIWTKRVIVLGVIYGLGWLFGPLLGVKLDIYWDRMNLGEHKTMKDVYYVNISGITYLNNKFYVLLNKPYLFNKNYKYIYSSSDLVMWKQEYSDEDNSTIYPIVDSDFRYTITESNFVQYEDKTSSGGKFIYDVPETSKLPFIRNGDCYIRYNLIDKNCNGDWKSINNLERVIYNNQPYFTENNIIAYKVINKMSLKLKIILGVAHTTYGNGEYVGVFYKNKQYYFMISTDGVHYEIKPAPSELVSSLAINLFN